MNTDQTAMAPGVMALRERLLRADPGEGGIPRGLEGHDRMLCHVPGDLTVRVEAGIRLADLQDRLAEAGQWLPLDPWDENATIGQIIDENLYGPRRFGFGAVREHLIGMEILLADGRLITSGGNVVKNVAGYDLMKLFVGAHGSLGCVVGATFKLAPRPRCERVFQRKCRDAPEADEVTDAVMATAVTPTVLDWHGAGKVTVVIAFSGDDADVRWQIGEIGALEFEEIESLDHDALYFGPRSLPPGRRTVAPSRLREAVKELGGAPFLARAGNGTLWSDAISRTGRPGHAGLEARLKALLDPRGILPPLP